MAELIKQFILDNPQDWLDKLSQSPYNIRITYDGDYVMFKYNQLSSDFNLPIVREARGIIFRQSDWKCVCHAFDKFGNYGESYCPEIDWSTASIQEKIDGSLMKVWYDNGAWHVSTNGTIDAAKAPLSNCQFANYRQLFDSIFPWSFFYMLASKASVYFFELVSPYNQVVIPYEETTLYFLGGRCGGHEFPPSNSPLVQFFDTPTSYQMNPTCAEDVQKVANKLPWDEEGYVVCDAQFNRIKIKSPAYVMAHHQVTSAVSDERLLQVILDNETAEFLIYANNTTKTRLHCIEDKMITFLQKCSAYQLEVDEYLAESKKDYAEYLNNHIPKKFHHYLFQYYDKSLDIFSYVHNMTKSQWLKIIDF